MVQKAKIEKFFGDRYEFYSKGFYDYENQVYLGRIWDNELGHWVPEGFQRRHPEVKVTSRVVFDKYCDLRMIDGKWKKHLLVSRLIYQAFHPEWDMFDNPRRHQINHKEEEETCNNDLDNLELMTSKQNSNYGTRNQRMAESLKLAMRNSTTNNRSKPVICIETQQIFDSQTSAAKFFGVSPSQIHQCCNKGYSIKKNGYHFRYLTEEEIQAHL